MSLRRTCMRTVITLQLNSHCQQLQFCILLVCLLSAVEHLHSICSLWNDCNIIVTSLEFCFGFTQVFLMWSAASFALLHCSYNLFKPCSHIFRSVLKPQWSGNIFVIVRDDLTVEVSTCYNGHKLTHNTCTKVSALFLAGPFMLTLRPSSPPWPPATPMARRPTPSYTPQWEMPYWGLWSAGLIERPWPFYKTGSARPLLSSNRMWVENPLMKVKHTIEPVNMKKLDTGKLI